MKTSILHAGAPQVDSQNGTRRLQWCGLAAQAGTWGWVSTGRLLPRALTFDSQPCDTELAPRQSLRPWNTAGLRADR